MKITEIIDSSGELIGSNDTPTSGSDLDTVAKGTTDQNMGTSHQPYRADMMGRFGFLGMPFNESKGEGNIKVMDELDELLFTSLQGILKKYYKNPDLLKVDFREIYNKSFEESPQKIKQTITTISNQVVEIFGNNIKNAIDKTNIDESKIVEDLVVSKLAGLDISAKSKDNELQSKELFKIAGFINKKLNKKSIDKLINLLEEK